jgi:hypothetical protein
MTALIHHVNTPEQFSPVTTVVLEAFKSAVASNTENAAKLLPVIVTICSVRRGSRLTRTSHRQHLILPTHLIRADSVSNAGGCWNSKRHQTNRGESYTTSAAVDFCAGGR